MYMRCEKNCRATSSLVLVFKWNAAVSIPSNIAEGYKRHNLGEYTHFCGIAEGSAAELETQLILTNKLFGINISQALDLLIEVQKMLYVLVQQLKTKR